MPCQRNIEDEWERAFVAPLEHDQQAAWKVHIPTDDQLADLTKRYDLLQCDRPMNAEQAFVANQIFQVSGLQTQRKSQTYQSEGHTHADTRTHAARP